MLSMTGFGSGESTIAGVTVTIELRAVNHRFLDVAMKLPPAISFLESDIRAFLKEKLARGRVTCMAQVATADETTPVVLDENRLNQGVGMLQEAAAQLTKATGQQQSITLDHLLQVPDLFRNDDTELAEDDLRHALTTALEQATAGLLLMKQKEGQELVDDMRQRMTTLRERLDNVEALVPQAVEEAHTRLQERIEQLLTDQFDPQRLAQEAALLADRANINEECERLAIHITQFTNTLDDDGQVAKRLNFLLQEMHREVNTMGSKTNLMDITQLVITMKDEIESVREQIQNLE